MKAVDEFPNRIKRRSRLGCQHRLGGVEQGLHLAANATGGTRRHIPMIAIGVPKLASIATCPKDCSTLSAVVDDRPWLSAAPISAIAALCAAYDLLK